MAASFRYSSKNLRRIAPVSQTAHPHPCQGKTKVARRLHPCTLEPRCHREGRAHHHLLSKQSQFHRKNCLFYKDAMWCYRCICCRNRTTTAHSKFLRPPKPLHLHLFLRPPNSSYSHWKMCSQCLRPPDLFSAY